MFKYLTRTLENDRGRGTWLRTKGFPSGGLATNRRYHVAADRRPAPWRTVALRLQLWLEYLVRVARAPLGTAARNAAAQRVSSLSPGRLRPSSAASGSR